MAIITIPAGLRIFNREIELEIEYDSTLNVIELIEVGAGQIGLACVTPAIRAALEAAAQYQKEIGEG